MSCAAAGASSCPSQDRHGQAHGARRHAIFASAIHEFAQSIGKERFLLVGEIAGGRKRAFETLETTGLDAALGIDDIPERLEWMVRGYRDPKEYFGLFRNSLLVGKDSHVWFRDKVVTLYDDHDQVRKRGSKARFCADAVGRRLALNALALNATTLGIPCIYSGSEQGFDGRGDWAGAPTAASTIRLARRVGARP